MWGKNFIFRKSGFDKAHELDCDGQPGILAAVCGSLVPGQYLLYFGRVCRRRLILFFVIFPDSCQIYQNSFVRNVALEQIGN